ncbi:hypothetical protein VNO78_09789 [Psophocarpus tetragonolobus]|uniref:Uncharacterized protein n=1 Tax=Psophocarpus tetragonolobus TaxID=3891 RepID=A0AAN9SWK4_PSOTE
MFEPRDMWSKLKEKGEKILSGAGWTQREPTSHGIQEKEKSSTGQHEHVQVHTPRFIFSEASLSMLVEWFSA